MEENHVLLLTALETRCFFSHLCGFSVLFPGTGAQPSHIHPMSTRSSILGDFIFPQTQCRHHILLEVPASPVWVWGLSSEFSQHLPYSVPFIPLPHRSVTSLEQILPCSSCLHPQNAAQPGTRWCPAFASRFWEPCVPGPTPPLL